MSSKKKTWESPLDKPDFDGNFPAVGHCIYCPKKPRVLTLEHIVPLGLNGNLKLPKSSCRDCARITGTEIEKNCLRTTFYYLRIRHDLKSRRKKDRPKYFPFEILTHGSPIKESTISAQQLPARSWTFLTFSDLPGILLSKTEDQSPQFSVKNHIDDRDAQLLFQHARSKTQISEQKIIIPTQSINPDYFARFLAKMSHAFTYAVLGGDDFEPCLQNYILNGSKKTVSYWVGNDEEYAREENTLWRLVLCEMKAKDDTVYLCVRIRLMAFAGAPSYLVVVGKSRSDKFSLLKARGYQRPIETALMV